MQLPGDAQPLLAGTAQGRLLAGALGLGGPPLGLFEEGLPVPGHRRRHAGRHEPSDQQREALEIAQGPVGAGQPHHQAGAQEGGAHQRRGEPVARPERGEHGHDDGEGGGRARPDVRGEREHAARADDQCHQGRPPPGDERERAGQGGGEVERARVRCDGHDDRQEEGHRHGEHAVLGDRPPSVHGAHPCRLGPFPVRFLRRAAERPLHPAVQWRRSYAPGVRAKGHPASDVR